VEKGSDSGNYKKQAKLRCFHCKEVGHPVYKCPQNLFEGSGPRSFGKE
jgi:hypothetical protein